MSNYLSRPHDISEAVEHQLAFEVADIQPIGVDPRIALLMSICGPATQFLAGYMRQRRNHDIRVMLGESPVATAVDGGMEYRHVVALDETSGTIIDPTPFSVLSFAGYHFSYITDVFPCPPEVLVGPKNIAEYEASPQGMQALVEVIMSAFRRIKPEALQVRDKLSMIGGQPFLDMPELEVQRVLGDIWDLSHYGPYPESMISAEFASAIARATERLLAIDS